jgi:hypothetical protein
MLILYLTGFGIFLSLAFYVYSGNLANQRSRVTDGNFRKSGRDMWVATLNQVVTCGWQLFLTAIMNLAKHGSDPQR